MKEATHWNQLSSRFSGILAKVASLHGNPPKSPTSGMKTAEFIFSYWSFPFILYASTHFKMNECEDGLCSKDSK